MEKPGRAIIIPKRVFKTQKERKAWEKLSISKIGGAP